MPRNYPKDPTWIPKGTDPTDADFTPPPASAPGCWKNVSFALAILVFLSLCAGLGIGASMAAKPPTPTTPATSTPGLITVAPITASPTTRPPTATPSPTNTQPPTPIRVSDQQANNPPYPTATPTYTPTITPTLIPCVGYHRVKTGQALYQIAQLWRVSTSALITANKLKNPDLLYTGQILKIPGRCSTPTSTP